MQVNRALTAAEIASRVARKNATTRDLSNLLWMILDKGIGYDIEQEVRDMLVEARKEAGLSRRQVETRVGVPYTNLSDFENGGRVPRLELIAKIAHAYGKRVVVQLVEEENASTPQPQLRNDQEVLAAVQKVMREEAEAERNGDDESEPVRKTAGRKPKYVAERAQKWNGGNK